jgi:hypothetical protein
MGITRIIIMMMIIIIIIIIMYCAGPHPSRPALGPTQPPT